MTGLKDDSPFQWVGSYQRRLDGNSDAWVEG
jgi:hypothetical protein